MMRHTIVFCCIAAAAWAQTDRGSIRGTVTDESRAVVADAVVTATNSSIGVSFAVRTTAAGTYNIAALPSGVYTVEVGQAGFKTVSQTVVVSPSSHSSGTQSSRRKRIASSVPAWPRVRAARHCRSTGSTAEAGPNSTRRSGRSFRSTKAA